MALGSYRNSPFVTGHGSSTNGFKTEILNYKSGNWEEGAGYPFSNGNRYVSNDFLEVKISMNWCIWETIYFVLEYQTMPRLQPVTVFWSLAAIQMVHQAIHQLSLNIKTGAGRMSETWPNLDLVMEQSPLDLSQWLLVAIQIVDFHRKRLSERNHRIILISLARLQNCGNSTHSNAMSSIQHYQTVTHTVSAYFLLTRITAAKLRSQ